MKTWKPCCEKVSDPLEKERGAEETCLFEGLSCEKAGEAGADDDDCWGGVGVFWRCHFCC